MDFSDFDRSFDKLETVLSEMTAKGKKAERTEIYGSYLDYHEEIKAIVQRIETEIQEFTTSTQKKLKALQEGEEIADEWSTTSMEYLVQIRLDVKSFFIFTRIFLDTLARIIRMHYGAKGHQLPWNMPDLIKHKTLEKIDSKFAEGLKHRMSWMDDFVKKRVEIEHYLGDMRSTQTRDGKFGFDILGLRTPQSWGTHTVQPITDYMHETLHSLSAVISHIYNRFQS